MSDLREILTSIGYDLKDFGKEYRARPLYRDSDNETVLSIDKNTGVWYDFKTNQGGGLEYLIQLTLKLETLDEARKMVPNLPSLVEKEEKPTANITRKYDDSVLLKLEKDHKYWTSRNISLSTLALFKGGIAPSGGKMSYRYVFPIFNENLEIIGFSGRDILKYEDSKRSKWKHIGEKNNWCYPAFLNKEYLAESKTVILVESIGDMLALWENDIKNVLVTFGLHANKSIIKLLIEIDVSKIFIAFNNDSDNEFAGNRAAEETRKKLLDYFDESQIIIAIPDRKDFGEMTTEQILSWKTHYLH